MSTRMSVVLFHALPQKPNQQRLDPPPQFFIRKPRPRHVRRDVHRRIERPRKSVRQHDARLLRDERGRAIVWMTAQTRGLSLNPIEEWPQVSIEPIVPHDQLVKLPSCRDVLVVEDE